MKKLFYGVSIVAMLTFGITSCEQVEFVNINNSEMLESDGIEMTFTISSIEQISFDDENTGTRATRNITELCSRITLVFFQDGKKVKTIHQKDTDDEFGNLQTTLPAGEYKFVALAHSSNGNPTITSLEEINFSSVKTTDTFYYYGELDVTEPQDLNLSLKRAVAMVRFVVSDNAPEEVTKMKFYYTGGSSTFNAITGYGSKNSKQTEYRDVLEAAHSGESYYEIYTFPHEQEGLLKLTVTAQTDDDDEYLERVFESIPVKINQITKYTGKFFENAQKPGEFKVTMTTGDEWTEEELYY